MGCFQKLQSLQEIYRLELESLLLLDNRVALVVFTCFNWGCILWKFYHSFNPFQNNLQQERCEIVPSWSRDPESSGSNCLDQIAWIKLSGSKLSGSNFLNKIFWIKIFWIKLSRSNYLDQIICIKLHGSNYLGTLNWNIQIILQGITP